LYQIVMINNFFRFVFLPVYRVILFFHSLLWFVITALLMISALKDI